MVDMIVYVAIIIAIIFRVVIMKGSFVFPVFYRNGNEVSFNLGSVTTIIVGILAALALMETQPELFANWYVAAITAYTAPQITDGIITAATRYACSDATEDETEELVDDEGV